jgi:ABC-2 type transport system ATP-binding protein
MLTAIDLCKRYDGHLALDQLNLHVAPGEVFCLLGANGAGKTTTLNLFLDFVERTSGSARVGDLDVAEHPLATKRLLAYLPEQVMLYPSLTGLENLAYFAGLAGLDLSAEAAREALERAGLAPAACGRRVRGYSKGMRQKVGLAIAMARRVSALLLDEPTSGLDPAAANEFGQQVAALARSGVAVLMATHDLFRAKELGTRIGIMKQGRLVAELDSAAIGHADLERLYLEHMRA